MKQTFKLLLFALALQLWPTAVFCQREDGMSSVTTATQGAKAFFVDLDEQNQSIDGTRINPSKKSKRRIGTNDVWYTKPEGTFYYNSSPSATLVVPPLTRLSFENKCNNMASSSWSINGTTTAIGTQFYYAEYPAKRENERFHVPQLSVGTDTFALSRIKSANGLVEGTIGTTIQMTWLTKSDLVMDDGWYIGLSDRPAFYSQELGNNYQQIVQHYYKPISPFLLSSLKIPFYSYQSEKDMIPEGSVISIYIKNANNDNILASKVITKEDVDKVKRICSQDLYPYSYTECIIDIVFSDPILVDDEFYIVIEGIDQCEQMGVGVTLPENYEQELKQFRTKLVDKEGKTLVIKWDIDQSRYYEAVIYLKGMFDVAQIDTNLVAMEVPAEGGLVKALYIDDDKYKVDSALVFRSTLPYHSIVEGEEQQPNYYIDAINGIPDWLKIKTIEDTDDKLTRIVFEADPYDSPTSEGREVTLRIKSDKGACTDYVTIIQVPKGDDYTTDYSGSDIHFTILDKEKKTCAINYMKIGDDGEIVIPKTIWGYDVVDIRKPNNANDDELLQYNEFVNSTKLKKITFHCKEVKSWFKDNKSTNEVIFGDGVTSIESRAFYGNTGLTSITIFGNVKSIGNYAFYDCTNLISVTSFIQKPFSCDYRFSEITYNNATLYVPASLIELYRNTGGWKKFKIIRPLYYKVLQCDVSRPQKLIHINVNFTIEPHDYSSLNEYVSLASENETLKLLSFEKSGTSLDLYFDFPKKEGTYILKIANTFKDIYGQELDQNSNSMMGEDEDNYIEEFTFGGDELYVIAQSPLIGMKGKAGFTDVVLNDAVSNIPVSQFSFLSPSGKETTITKIDYLDDLTPARHRIFYDVLEEDGIYSFTIHKGLKSSKGWDMRYDYQAEIDVPYADLKPMKIIPESENWVAGKKLSISYHVNNVSEMPAIGNSINVIYLSSSEKWSNEAIEISRDTLDINLQSQENYTRTIEVTIPPCIEGHYYLILKTNVARTINELSFDDNTLVSDALSLSVDWLTEDNNQFILNRGESRLFKVPVESDKNIEVVDNHGTANMSVGYGDLPNVNEEPRNGNVIILSPDMSMIYYLLVTNNNRNQEKTQLCELSIRNFDLAIDNVGRRNVVKHKTAWIPIEVIGCTDMPIFYLADTYGKRTESKNVRVKSESLFYAQFDTEALQVGKYNLYVECDGKTGMLPNAITITQEEALPNIKAKLVLPSNSRIGSTITAYIDYENTGNVDITAPLFILTGQERSKYSLDDHEFITDEVHIIGVNEKGVMNALLPGESNRISVKITIPNEQIYSAKYKLKTISEGGDGIDEKFYLQYLDVDPDEKPNCYTDEEWNAYCTRLRNNVGDTWLTFIQALGTVAGMYFSADYIEHDAHFLYDILKETDLQAAFNNSYQIKKKTDITFGYVEPGTLFIWKNGQWNQVVKGIKDVVSETLNGETYNYVDLHWEPTDNMSLVNYSASKNFIISHGWNDGVDGGTKQLAEALAERESNCNIFGIDWRAKATYPSSWISLSANVPALNIPNVADRVIKGLCTIFGSTLNNLRINNLHLIGHSHGAHLCGMIAHKLNFKPKRLTALDASQQWSHVGWLGVGFNADNFMGSGWNSSDVQFLDYYKSSVMAGTNRFKGNNNFILIESDNGFAFDKFSDETTEEKRHGYSIEWFAKSILNKDLKIGYNLTPNYLKDNWGNGYNESQYHGVINGTSNVIENYSIRDERGISTGKWNYTEPWYGKYVNQGLFNDLSFRNALASSVEYEPVSIDPYYDGNNFLETGTTENVKLKFKNTADNFTIPLSVRESEVGRNAVNSLFITNSNNSTDYSIVKNKDGISEVRPKTQLYLLGYDNSYGDISKDGSKETEANISFKISTELWDQLAGAEKNEEYIYCDLWFISGTDHGANFIPNWVGDWNNPTYYIPDTPTGTSFKNIKIWKGELYPDNNVIIRERVKVQRPTLECDAGKDRRYIIDCHQDYVDVDVNGIVVRDNGKPLSYFWEKNGYVFSHSKSGTISLGVGKHRLTFRIKVKDENSGKAAFASTSSVNEATDDVYIIVKKETCDEEEEEETKTAWSWDPNEKVGIRGAGGKSCVRQGETMEYAIYFENDAEKAQLAAQTVTVIDTLDTAFDLSTFEFTGSEVANTYIDIPSGKAETIVYTDLRPANDLILKADMKLDIDTRELKVVYSSLDTLTYEPTQDVFAGFLPPNDSTHIGEGHFSYRVKLKNDIPDGYQVKNQAHIFFDYNDEIATNVTMHTIDSTAPMSTVDGLPSETEKDSIMVSWSGVDDGAGIKYFDVYCSKNGGSYELWKSHVTEHSAILYGMKGDVYRFYSVATDSLGFVETMKTSPEATITFTGDPSSVSTIGNDAISIEYQNGAFIIIGAEGATCNVYDLAGQLVVSKQRIDRKEYIAFNRKGVYVVNVENPDGVTFAKKVVVK